MESKGDIRQDLGVLIDLFYGELQRQNMLVEFCHHTANKVIWVMKEPLVNFSTVQLNRMSQNVKKKEFEEKGKEELLTAGEKRKQNEK